MTLIDRTADASIRSIEGEVVQRKIDSLTWHRSYDPRMTRPLARWRVRRYYASQISGDGVLSHVQVRVSFADLRRDGLDLKSNRQIRTNQLRINKMD